MYDIVRGWWKTVGTLIESSWPLKKLTDLDLHADKTEYAFIEFKISSGTVSTEFRQPLT